MKEKHFHPSYETLSKEVVMEIAISIVLAYLLSGVSQVMEGLGSRITDKPGWACQPTVGTIILIATTFLLYFLIKCVALWFKNIFCYGNEF